MYFLVHVIVPLSTIKPKYYRSKTYTSVILLLFTSFFYKINIAQTWARETAETLAKAIGCPVKFEEELMEFNNGIQAGMFEEAKSIQSQNFFMIVLKMGNLSLSFE